MLTATFIFGRFPPGKSDSPPSLPGGARDFQSKT
jgi:hypothetical protein